MRHLLNARVHSFRICFRGRSSSRSYEFRFVVRSSYFVPFEFITIESRHFLNVLFREFVVRKIEVHKLRKESEFVDFQHCADVCVASTRAISFLFKNKWSKSPPVPATQLRLSLRRASPRSRAASQIHPAQELALGTEVRSDGEPVWTRSPQQR